MSKRKWLLLLSLLCLYSNFCSLGRNSQQNRENILIIGTTKDRLKSASLLGDATMASHAQISNPPLMTMTGEDKIEGLVVKDWEISDDLTEWTFHLRPELYWSDGTKVSAEDVRFSMELFAREVPYARWMRGLIGKILVSGENSLSLTLNRPYTRLDFDFTTYNILPKHIWEKIDDPLRFIQTDEIVGCGPFVIERVDLNSGIISFAKNPYWKGEKPEIEGIELQLYSNKDVLALALEKGEVDTFYRYASSYPYPDIARLKSTGKFDFLEEPSLGLKFLAFNIKKRPMSDLRFREAVSCAVDYGELIKLDILNHGEIANKGFIPRVMSGFTETEKLGHDPRRAKNILEKAGYSDLDGNGIREDREGRDLRLSLLISDDYARLAELVKDYLTEVGIGVVLRSVDDNTWTSLKDRYDYDLLISRTSPWGMFMHADWATGYFDSRRTGEGVLHNIDDPEFLAICDTILSTTDEARLQALAVEVQNYYARHLPAIALYWSRNVTPYQKKFTGWTPNPLYGIYNIKNFLNLRIRGQDAPAPRS
jgi:peptide/nickel transport system substrate-binding protein